MVYGNLNMHAATDRGKWWLKTSPPLKSPILGGVTKIGFFSKLRMIIKWFKVRLNLYRFCDLKKFFGVTQKFLPPPRDIQRTIIMPKNGQNKAFFEHFLWVKLWVTKRSSLRGVEYSEGPKLSKMWKMTLNLHVEQKIIITR